MKISKITFGLATAAITTIYIQTVTIFPLISQFSLPEMNLSQPRSFARSTQTAMPRGSVTRIELPKFLSSWSPTGKRSAPNRFILCAALYDSNGHCIKYATAASPDSGFDTKKAIAKMVSAIPKNRILPVPTVSVRSELHFSICECNCLTTGNEIRATSAPINAYEIIHEIVRDRLILETRSSIRSAKPTITVVMSAWFTVAKMPNRRRIAADTPRLRFPVLRAFISLRAVLDLTEFRDTCRSSTFLRDCAKFSSFGRSC
ncbi:hypothetical protein DFQ13_11185 [Actinokineospora spheciospongiae]|nr:hypothetical protein DFQ13_11185 [Actinokineospora spheciospongiae]